MWRGPVTFLVGTPVVAGGLAASLVPHTTPVLGSGTRGLGLRGEPVFLPGWTIPVLPLAIPWDRPGLNRV